ncbi:MAG: hypothetical protein IV100_02460 [Myxococcales bacterium]|nr:hypothetical protein [Myxococcales bacterium]
MTRFALLMPLSTALFLGSCVDLECGLGTHEREGQCVPNVPVACGPGTQYERGYCVVATDDVVAPGDAVTGD